MAWLTRIRNSARYILGASHLVGRGSACALRLDNRLVSSEHASFRWSLEGWELRDLSSRNGTYFDGQRLPKGDTVRIRAGAHIAFGDTADVFELSSDAAPIATAAADDGTVRYEQEGVLVLPSPERPELFIFEDEPGYWFAEWNESGECRRVDDGMLLQCSGSIWRIALPVVWERTWIPGNQAMRIAQIGLQFRVSPHLEHVEVAVRCEGRQIALKPRAHLLILLELARARLQDQRRADLRDEERGWILVPKLLHQLQMNEDAFNVAIYRARAQLREADVIDAQSIVQRRRLSHEIRIGVPHLEIIE